VGVTGLPTTIFFWSIPVRISSETAVPWCPWGICWHWSIRLTGNALSCGSATIFSIGYENLSPIFHPHPKGGTHCPANLCLPRQANFTRRMQRDRLHSLANCIRERWVFPGGQRRWLKVKLFRWCIFALDLDLCLCLTEYWIIAEIFDRLTPYLRGLRGRVPAFPESERKVVVNFLVGIARNAETGSQALDGMPLEYAIDVSETNWVVILCNCCYEWGRDSGSSD